MRKCQYALEEIVFDVRQAEEGKRMSKIWLYMGELTCAAVSQMGISSQHSSQSHPHLEDCWQPAKMGQCETREIRGRIEV